MATSSKKLKTLVEKVQILDESTGQIIVKEQTHLNTDFILSPNSSLEPGSQVIILEHHEAPNQQYESTIKQQNLLNSGLSPHIVQNYSILAQEITAPLENTSKLNDTSDLLSSTTKSSKIRQKNKNKIKDLTTSSSSSSSSIFSLKSVKDTQHATCQFCGLAMLKKNIPTHIRRAHTPKEELVCLNEEENIFTFNYLKPGQRRKRSTRAYDYSLMTATVSIDEDNDYEGIENKFITEGEEILSTDLLQLGDRIKYGIAQISTSTLNKLVDILTKIEYSTQGEVCLNAKSIRSMICYYLASGEEFKYKIRQVNDEINDKKKQVNNLRADLKEVMTRKAQLERRIQPLVCELQRLEDHHGSLIEAVSNQMGDLEKNMNINNNNNNNQLSSFIEVEEDNTEDI
jgi:hypothetical protein